MTRFSPEHMTHVERISRVLYEAHHDLTAWVLAVELGESEETVANLGAIVYQKLGAALGVDPNGDAVLAIAAAVMATNGPEAAARRQLIDLDITEGAS